ncbi:unnamed protein product [Nesidiocoris tenuis]|uniref:Uncharacterized protein n=1 Tax=Nesidiocoris tenuis TaxID=355587 RepID=A0A6H5G3E5_9HEMI|nr:unnamed protein product [Nesidiocoris tenuis]
MVLYVLHVRLIRYDMYSLFCLWNQHVSNTSDGSRARSVANSTEQFSSAATAKIIKFADGVSLTIFSPVKIEVSFSRPQNSRLGCQQKLAAIVRSVDDSPADPHTDLSAGMAIVRRPDKSLNTRFETVNKECLAVGYVLFVRGRRLSFWPRSALTRSLRSPRCGRRQVHEFSRLFPYLNIEDSCFIYSCLQEPRSLPAQACSELPNPNWKPNPTPNLQKNQTNQFSRQPQNQGPSSFQNHPKPSFSVQKPIQPPRPASTQAVPMSWRTSNPNFHNMETGQETGNELENPGDNETENQIEYDQNYASDQEHFLDDTGLPQEFPDSN